MIAGRRRRWVSCLRDGVLNERWIVAHLNELTPEDFQLLERAPRFHIAHCPRSHAYFGHSPFAITKLRALGYNICLGTDSLASNDDLSLFAEMRKVSQIGAVSVGERNSQNGDSEFCARSRTRRRTWAD